MDAPDEDAEDRADVELSVLANADREEAWAALVLRLAVALADGAGVVADFGLNVVGAPCTVPVLDTAEAERVSIEAACPPTEQLCVDAPEAVGAVDAVMGSHAGEDADSDREVLARLVRELHSERLDELGEAADGWRAFVGESDAVVVAVVAPRGYELRACRVGVVLRLVEARDVPLEEVGHLEELEVGGEAHDAAELVELLALEVVASGRARTDAEELCSCNSARKTCPLLA